ncbi:hypothetical protein MASR1M90_06160 [Desulfovibrionales bacterium]
MHAPLLKFYVTVCLGTALLLTGTGSQAMAHALYATDTWHEGVVLVQFSYAGGDQPSYAAVEVYSPADDKLEFQNGRTDAQGRFAFMPDVQGRWRIIMADNMGHRVEHPVEVNIGSSATSTGTGDNSGVGEFALSLRILLGLSLLANLGLAGAVLRQTSKPVV